MGNETIKMGPSATPEGLESKVNDNPQSVKANHAWSVQNWYRVLSILLFGVCFIFVIAYAGRDVHAFLNNPAIQNVTTSSTITSNSVFSCLSAVNGVLSQAISGTNSVPVNVTVITTTSPRAITDGQWYALILLLIPLILSALVAIVALRNNDDD